MRFYCITNDKQNSTNILLKNACKARQIEFISAQTFVDQEVENDLVYRTLNGSHKDVLSIERRLIAGGATSFYSNYNKIAQNYDLKMDFDSTVFNHTGLAIPKTWIIDVADNHDLIVSKISQDNFPVVIKVLGGSHGVGVIRVDSYSSLLSMIDYLRSRSENFVVKEYVKVDYSLRLIVLGNQVIDSIRYEVPVNDFRSNVGPSPLVHKTSVDDLACMLAIDATSHLGLEFSGVDLLMTERGLVLSEVNFPCFFPRCQNLTGINIAERMIDFLIQKSNTK